MSAQTRIVPKFRVIGEISAADERIRCYNTSIILSRQMKDVG